MRRLLSRTHDLARDERAVSAIEFSIILPILVLLVLGGLQVVAYVNATRKVALVAQSISQMLSRAQPPQGSTTATVSATDIHFSYDAALVLFPYVMKDAQRQNIPWWNDITINYAGIQFTQTSSNCPNSADMSACYVANVVWTSTGIASPSTRPCVTPQLPADNTAPPSSTTLPRSVYGPGSLIVVDVMFNFTPSFGRAFLRVFNGFSFTGRQIARSVYVQPRYASLITYDNVNNNDGIASRCPGY